MFDKNGHEIKTGDIVEITGAYFKNDNGLYFVDNSPGDPNWERQRPLPAQNQQNRADQQGKIQHLLLADHEYRKQLG